jgi:putative transposase
MLCQIARISRSGYYKWLKTGDNKKDELDYLIIKKIFDDGKKKLGWRPIQTRLGKKCKIIMNHKKIKRIMREYGLVVTIRRRNPYKDIMKKDLEHRTCANILNRGFKQTIPGKVLSTDITYLYYGYGQRAYLSVVKDIASKEIVSWQMSSNITLKFVLDSIDDLKNVKTISNETMIHSDQGSHYTSPEYRAKVKEIGITQSMSRKGNCIDNAPIESFFGHLKDDVDYSGAKNFNELKEMIGEYIKYYNNERYQWDIKKMTPVEYRDHLLAHIE